MTTTNILIIIALGTLVVSIVSISLYLWNNLKIQREKLYFERKNRDMEYEMRREEMYYSRNKLQKEESEYNYLPKIMEEIPYLVERSINSSQKQYHYELRKLIDSNFKNIDNKINTINFGDDTNILSKQLIREISHSLNTPFSLIEVTVDNILNEENIEKIRESLLSIKSSVEICKSFMTSFRELTLIVSSSNMWNPDSLVESINSAYDLYKHKNNKKNKAIINLPEKINGFTNNYILSLLLPLMENAIESAIPKSDIVINCEKQENVIKLIVSNTPNSLPETDDIYSSGFTTKKDHDGLGLSIVKHLLESQRESKIEHIISGKNISFIITLIGRN